MTKLGKMLVSVRSSRGTHHQEISFKKRRKEDPESYRLLSLISVRGKIIEQIFHRSYGKAYVRETSRSSEIATKGILCLTSLMAFHDEVSALVDKERTTVVIYLDFCRAFDMLLVTFLSLNQKDMELKDDLFSR